MAEGLEEELDAMCNLSQGVEDAAKKKAKKKQAIRDIKNVMESLDLSAAKAMEILKIPEKKRAKYEKLISS